MMSEITDIIEQTRQAQQEHERRIDVQLELPSCAALAGSEIDTHSVSWTQFWTCACGVDRLDFPWVSCPRCNENAPAFDKPKEIV